MAAAGKPGKRRVKRFYDYELLISIIFLCVFGLVMIFSASSYKAQLESGKSYSYVWKQAMFEAVGFVIMIAVSKMDYHKLMIFAWPSYIASYVMLFLTMFTPFGVASHGKKRWLKLGPIQFQPTEFVKIALIMLLASLITYYGLRINEELRVRNGWRFWTWESKWWKLVLLSAPLTLLVTRNNLSSGIIIAGIVYVMLFVAMKKKWGFIALLGGLVAILFVSPYIGDFLESIHVLQDYQLSRIHVWRNPVKYSQSGGYQVLQGLYAIGSGGILGKGLGQSLQKLGFVPEAQNDMIFTIICEELGLFGAICLIAMFVFMIYRFAVIAENAPDLLGSMLVVGIMAHIAIQVILNIAVVTNVIPNTGVTLPFISYGGTSVMLLMVEMGLALSVSNRIRQYENNG